MKNKKDTIKYQIIFSLIIGISLLFFAIGYKISENKHINENQTKINQENLDAEKEFYEPIFVSIVAGVKEETNADNSNDTISDTGNMPDSGYNQEQEKETWENNQEEQEEIYSDSSEEPILEEIEEVEKIQYGARDVLLSEDEMWELVRIIYFENGIVYPECTYITVKYTADVLLNRLQQWGYADAYEVIFDPGQYSTAYKYENVGKYDECWEISWAALYDALENPDYTPVFQSTFPQGTTYYTDPYTGECFGY